MAPRRTVHGPDGRAFTLVRPLLDAGRDELRHHIRVLQVPWVEDPTNADPRHDRARIRVLLGRLAEEGLGADALAGAASRLRRSRTALSARAAEVARRAWLTEPRWAAAGALGFDRDIWDATERDTRARLLSAAVRWVSGAAYRPRREPLESMLDRIGGGGGGTLAGCIVRCEDAALRIAREPAAVAELSVPARPGAIWDAGWRFRSAGFETCELRALGETGWRAAGGDSAKGPPHRAALALPALWRGADLIGCAPLGFGAPHELDPPGAPDPLGAFVASLLSD
jgi:tRNA(Ile)-lysidine synthase